MEVDLTYRSAFERLWDEKSSNAVSNSKPEHAAAIIAVFFSRAKKRVHILCTDLNKEVYDNAEVMTAFRKAVDAGVSVDIVLQDKAAEGSKFLELINKTSQDRSEQIAIKENAREQIKGNNVNFAYADDHAFRFEQDGAKMEAVASAWNPKIVEVLATHFAAIKAKLAKSDVSTPTLSSTATQS